MDTVIWNRITIQVTTPKLILIVILFKGVNLNVPSDTIHCCLHILFMIGVQKSGDIGLATSAGIVLDSLGASVDL